MPQNGEINQAQAEVSLSISGGESFLVFFLKSRSRLADAMAAKHASS